MTREETKSAVEVMMAFAEGKTVEFSWNDGKTWVEIKPYDCCWNWRDNDYRIKPKPKYRPFANAEEVMEAIKEHKDWIKYDEYIDRIVGLAKSSVSTVSANLDYDSAFRKFTFLDGTPFGKLDEN